MTTMVLLAILVCAGCREETTGAGQVSQVPSPNQYDSPHDQKRDERVIAIECEMTNMPRKLKGRGWDTMCWGVNLARSIKALDDRDERSRLMNLYFDSMIRLMTSLNSRKGDSLAFYNYEYMMESCLVFSDDLEIAERVMRIICDCVRLHRREVQKWSDAIMNEPNRRARTPLKNIHGVLNSDFMDFTNRIERDYFPWMKSHGLPPDRHEHWRRQLDAAYEMKESAGTDPLNLHQGSGLSNRKDTL